MNNQTKKILKAKSHALDATLRVGKFGVTPAFIAEVQKNLKTQSLLKIKVLKASTTTPKESAELIVQALPVKVLRVVGSIITITKETN